MAKKNSAFIDAIADAAAGGGGVAKRPKAIASDFAGGTRKDTRAHRIGRVNVTGYFDPAVKSSFRAIQMKHPELSLQDILEEALDDLFAKHNVPQTARLHREKDLIDKKDNR
jgi:hypothetical protein